MPPFRSSSRVKRPWVVCRSPFSISYELQEALGGTGDAYVQLKDYDKATTFFKKAADKAGNKFLSPFYLKKLGLVYEEQKDYKSAEETYKKIKSDYPESTEAQAMDGYIARVQAKM